MKSDLALTKWIDLYHGLGMVCKIQSGEREGKGKVK